MCCIVLKYHLALCYQTTNQKTIKNITIMKRVLSITNIIGLLILIPGLFIGYLSHNDTTNTQEENTVQMDEIGTNSTNVLNRSVRFNNF